MYSNQEPSEDLQRMLEKTRFSKMFKEFQTSKSFFIRQSRPITFFILIISFFPCFLTESLERGSSKMHLSFFLNYLLYVSVLTSIYLIIYTIEEIRTRKYFYQEFPAEDEVLEI